MAVPRIRDLINELLETHEAHRKADIRWEKKEKLDELCEEFTHSTALNYMDAPPLTTGWLILNVPTVRALLEDSEAELSEEFIADLQQNLPGMVLECSDQYKTRYREEVNECIDTLEADMLGWEVEDRVGVSLSDDVLLRAYAICLWGFDGREIFLGYEEGMRSAHFNFVAWGDFCYEAAPHIHSRAVTFVVALLKHLRLPLETTSKSMDLLGRYKCDLCDADTPLHQRIFSWSPFVSRVIF